MTYTDEQVEAVARAIHRERQVAGYSGQAAWEHEPHEMHVLYMRTARAAIAALQPQDGWQDIATAPKTDPVNMRALPFLGWCPDKTAPLGGDIRVIWWEPLMQRADETSPRARWYGDRDMEERPTHWRPLPAPPAAELERAPKQDGLADLRALSEKATDGPWSEEQPRAGSYNDEGTKVSGPPQKNKHGDPIRYYTAQFCKPDDATFIVACVNYVRAKLTPPASKG